MPDLRRFTFDVKLFTTVSVAATDAKHAEQLVRECLDGRDLGLGYADGGEEVHLGEAGIDGELDLQEESPPLTAGGETNDGVSFGRGRWTLHWEWIGEGHNGDYDPDDEQDERLLRADLAENGGEGNGGEGWSTCTGVPFGFGEDILRGMAERPFDLLDAGRSPKRAMEDLSWCSAEPAATRPEAK